MNDKLTPQQAYELYRLACAYRCFPSELVFDERRHAFDLAVWRLTQR